ncbi:hypothetical protein Tco_0150896 [Tanacetum coccineum]
MVEYTSQFLKLQVEGEVVNLMVQRTLCATKFEDFSQRNKIFETKCLIEDNVCSLLIDGGSCENLVSKELVKALKLPTEQHPYPCELDSIKKCPGVEVNEIFKIPIVVGSSYRDVVACDVVDLSATRSANRYYGDCIMKAGRSVDCKKKRLGLEFKMDDNNCKVIIGDGTERICWPT